MYQRLTGGRGYVKYVVYIICKYSTRSQSQLVQFGSLVSGLKIQDDPSFPPASVCIIFSVWLKCKNKACRLTVHVL